MKLFYTLLIIGCATVGAFAQNIGINPVIDYKQTALSQDDTSFNAEYAVVLNALSLASNNSIIITPRLEAVNGADVHVFPSFVISGSKRNKLFERSASLSGKQLTTPVYVRKNNSEQIVPIQLSTALKPWMKEAKLVFAEEVSGCAECGLGKYEHEFVLPVLVPYVPSYTLLYITPEAEAIKERSKDYAAKFNYKVGKYDILPDFGQNAHVISEIRDIINEVKADKNLTITGVKITGYASPEGSSASNLRLSENRAKGFASFLERNYDFLSGAISVNWKGEDWDGLYKIVESSSISSKSQIIDIINNIQNEDQRDASLKKFDNGTVYQTLLTDYYPQLRRNELTIGFVVKAFDVEEAKKIIRTSPQYLSLNEMYLVANSYPKESKEFKEVFDIASRLYPQDEVAQLNAATADIEAGSIDRAITVLEKLQTADAWNNIGVAYAKKGDINKATIFFEKAIKAGHQTAKLNLEELNKTR